MWQSENSMPSGGVGKGSPSGHQRVSTSGGDDSWQPPFRGTHQRIPSNSTTQSGGMQDRPTLQERVTSFPSHPGQDHVTPFSGPGGLPRHSAPVRAPGDEHSLSPLQNIARLRDDMPPRPSFSHDGYPGVVPTSSLGTSRTASNPNSSEVPPRTFSHQRVPSGGSGNPSPIPEGSSHFSHQRVPSGSSRQFTHRRVESGSSTTSGVSKSMVTPRHDSSQRILRYYDVVRELGKGSFGVVKLVTDRATRTHERVCKTVSTVGLQPGVLDMVRKEVELLKTLDHPHVVKLFEYVEDFERQEFLLILEYVPGGSCSEYLKKSMFPLGEAIVARLIYQVLAASAYCHSMGVAHRDVKPEHMMLTQVGLWGEPNCKLIDFGLAAFTTSASSQDFVGTPEYMAPEVVTLATTDATKTDIWSIGISTIELLTSKSPFGKPLEYGSNEPVYANVRRYGTFRDIEATLEDLRSWKIRSEEAKDFAYWLLVKDPNMRPGASDCLGHPWLEQQREKRSSLTKEMIRSMQGYIRAHPLVRCCLYVVSARSKVKDSEHYEAAFVGLDSDCDGEISRDDLGGALKKPAEWWDTADLMSLLQLGGSSSNGSSEFDPAELVDAADLDQSGGLSFTEFMATCLYVKQDSDKSLAERVFDALDSDRDGQVYASDLFDVFPELEITNNQALPNEKPIILKEWVKLFNPDFTQPTFGRPEVKKKTRRAFC